MRNTRDTIPLDPASLTECHPCEGRGHLRCDCPRQTALAVVSDQEDAAPPDPKAFEAVVMPLVPKLRDRASYYLIGNLGTRRDDVQDLVQETLLRAWKAWGRYEVKNPWGWLFLIMRNVFFDTQRDAKYRRGVIEAHADEIAEVRALPPLAPDAGVTAGPDDELADAVRQLSDAQRSVIEMQLLGVDDATTAKHLAIDVKTVRTASWKARAKIRALL